MCATWHGGEAEAGHLLSEYDISFYSDGNLRVGRHWDGDGTLAFATPQFGLVNDDCKKDRGWTLTSFNPRVIDIHRLKLNEEAGGLTAHQRLAYLGDPDYGSLNAAILGLLGLHCARLDSFETLSGQAVSTVRSLVLLALSPAPNLMRIRTSVEPIARDVSLCIARYRKARDRTTLETSLRYLEAALGRRAT